MRNVELTLAAEEDLTNIWLYTYETWGIDQAEKYYDLIVSCCEAIGSSQPLSKPVEGLPANIHIHNCERHYIFFMPQEHPIILAILHERMDFVHRLKDRL